MKNSKLYGFFIGSLNFIFFVITFHYVSIYLPYLWTSPEEMAQFTEADSQGFRNTQGLIELIGYFVAAFIANKSYHKVVDVKTDILR